MTVGSPPEEAGSGTKNTDAELRTHIRGSSLLLLGRVISIFLNFATQVLTVRYLTKGDYGAFSWAIAMVTMGSTLSLLSMQKAVSRFLPIFLEKNDRPSQRGTILLAVGSTLTFGLAIIALAFVGHGWLTDTFVSDTRSVGLLLILVALVPMQGLDSLLHALFAVLASPRAIFFRRHILSPLFRLAAVITVIAIAGSVEALAIGYLVAGALGIAAYLVLLRRLLARLGLFGGTIPEKDRGVKVPARELYRFGLPLVTTDLLWFLKTTVVVIILEALEGTDAVAEFRAVVPLAALNVLILHNIRILYLPLASRLLARDDAAGVGLLYARTTAWITVITFPIFAVCVFLAEPVTTLLFGERYSSAATILTVLAIGQFIDAAFGVNLATLNAFARVRFIAFVNVFIALLAVGAQFLLIPRYGALGAAAAATGTIVVQNVIHQTGLIRLTGVGTLSGASLRVYGVVLGVLALLVGARFTLDSPVLLAGLIAIGSLGILRFSRDTLDIAETFPELKKVPGLGKLVSSPRPSDRCE